MQMETVEPSENSQLDSDVEEPEIVELMNQEAEDTCTVPLRPVKQSEFNQVKRMSWLRGEIEALRSFPSLPERLMRPFRKMIRRKSSQMEETVEEATAEIPRVDEMLIPPNPFGSPSGMYFMRQGASQSII